MSEQFLQNRHVSIKLKCLELGVLVEGDYSMSEQPPIPPPAPDFPDHWGFYLLQAINR